MLHLIERLDGPTDREQGVLVLPFSLRQKSRFRGVLLDGEDVGIFLPRGQVLRDGDLLRAEDGRVIRVEAEAETLSTVYCSEGQDLARICYHLGNRHVPLQIGVGFARYLADHVLDDMVRRLGLTPLPERAPFEPEAGAYQGHAAGGGHHHAANHVPAAGA